jgi:hypothetical protein
MLLVLLGLWMVMCLGIREESFRRRDSTVLQLKKGI